LSGTVVRDGDVSVAAMLAFVLGAPGSGKSTVTPILRRCQPPRLIIDWDQFMAPAGRLAGRRIREDPSTWPAYADVVRAVVGAAGSVDTILLGVSTPEELGGWPIDAWLLLDCTDEVRSRRLRDARRGADVDGAVRDASSYRALGLPTVDSSERSPYETASRIVELVCALAP
jgi:hypothetical protein